jgi:hypothetical protein
MFNAELLIEEIKTLPASRVEQALDFVEFIKQKEINKAEGECDVLKKGGERNHVESHI